MEQRELAGRGHTVHAATGGRRIGAHGGPVEVSVRPEEQPCIRRRPVDTARELVDDAELYR